EQEAWIVDEKFFPRPENQFLLDKMQNDLLSPELAQFNIELNVTPQQLSADGLSKIHKELQTLWNECNAALKTKNLKMQMIGIMPTVTERELSIENMSRLNRYYALNEQVIKARGGKPLRLDIVGKEHLRVEHYDVMLESAATSFQIHRQIPFKESARYYNSSIILSAPLVAIGANSPYLFYKSLWEETRIPLFEEAVEVGGYGHASQGPIRRVSFGNGYARNSILECFVENLNHFPILLPVTFDEPPEKMKYLRMHNGTIWRWNRPLIGFDEDNTPHLRVEQRVASAGPTITDEMANTAFFYGLHEYYSKLEDAPEFDLEFSQAKSNFYLAAQHGLEARINWLDGKKGRIDTLILEKLLPEAAKGLDMLGIDATDSEYYLSIIEQRARSKQNGAYWQKQFVEKYGFNMHDLCEQYWQNQTSEKPVHEWKV
ncbi:MAG: glutamate--cysteine ligase, partial [Gammaproteobacteria bacterium]|nr:glutamate--cysteine ligase [Gammaproteobacteria bacterium]